MSLFPAYDPSRPTSKADEGTSEVERPLNFVEDKCDHSDFSWLRNTSYSAEANTSSHETKNNSKKEQSAASKPEDGRDHTKANSKKKKKSDKRERPSMTKVYSIVYLLEAKKYIVVQQSELSVTQEKDLYIFNHNGRNVQVIVALTGDIYTMEKFLSQIRSFETTRKRFSTLEKTSRYTQTYSDFPTESTGLESEAHTSEGITGVYFVDETGELNKVDERLQEDEYFCGNELSSTPNEQEKIPLEMSGPFDNEDSVLSSKHVYTSGGEWQESPSKRKLQVASSWEWEDRSPKRILMERCEDQPVGDVRDAVKRVLFDQPRDITSPDDKSLDAVEEQANENENVDLKGKKKYFCIFCKKLIPHFARHLVNNHKDKEEVISISSLPKQSKERKELLKEIRGRGAIFFNTQQNLNKGKLIVSRRKQDTRDMYKPCPICKNYYSKDSLYRHYKQCTKDKQTDSRKLQSESSSAMLKYSFEGKASEKMTTEVLPGMIKDKVTKRVLKDPFIIEYGNYLCVKHTKDVHLINYVRNKLRQIANLVNIMNDINPEITSLEKAFKPQHFDTFMESVRVASGYSCENGTFRAPSLVTQLGHGMKVCAERLGIFSIKTEDEDLKCKVNSWIEIYNHEFYNSLGKPALEDSAQKKWNKPRLLPFTEDIMKLNNFVKSTAQEAEVRLNQDFDKRSFDNLNKAILLQILIFNRKRVGESERLLVNDFKRRHNIQKDSEIYNSLSNSEKVVASRYSRVEIRGKKGRPVPILISHDQARSIERILSLRREAGVSESNNFVFGRGKKDFYKAGQALRDAAVECGAEKAKLITGTSLRKEIATTSQALSFTDNDMAVLADFMGHNIETHRHFYRMPSEVMHLARISQLLIALDEGKISKFHGKSLEEINVDIELDLPDEPDLVDPNELVPPETIETEAVEEQSYKSQEISTKNEKRDKHRKTTPKKSSNVRKKWNTPERHKVREVFSNYIKNGRVPSPSKCIRAIKNHPELKKRTVSQLKAWVYYEIQRNKKAQTKK